jgi:radical SAM protein with 4Fe4S-binding SPASM domain
MRIRPSIKLLDGIRRSAVYDTDLGLCWPASDLDTRVLRALSAGKRPEAKTSHLIEMRNKRWIEAGTPRPHDLTIHRTSAENAPTVLENVWIEITNSCNLKCSHCYAKSGPDVDRSSELSDEDWLVVADKIVDYGVRKVTFIGGEPTLRISLVDRISKHIKSKNDSISLRMFSNLAIGRLTDEILRVVEEHGIEFGTALYGIDAHSHDQMTKKTGSWNKTTEAIKKCLEKGIDVFVGMYVPTIDTELVKRCQSFLRTMGVTRFEILAPSKVGRAKDQNWRNDPLHNTLPAAMSFSSHQWQVSQDFHNCFHDHFSVLPDGNIAPCIMMRDTSYGNIRDTEIDKILSSPNYTSMAGISKDRIPGCCDCEFKYACFDCRPDAMSGTNDVLKKPNCGYEPAAALGEPISAR